MLALVSIMHSITIFPEAFMTEIEILSLCTSMPIYLVLVIKWCSFLEGLSRTLKTYSKRGTLYIALSQSSILRHRTAGSLGTTVSNTVVVPKPPDHQTAQREFAELPRSRSRR